MRNVFFVLVLATILSACAGAAKESPTASLPSEIPFTFTPESVSGTATLAESTGLLSTSTPVGDFFTQSGITLPTPAKACTALTQAQTEGPYYKADAPQRNSLLEEGMPGTRLILVGYVLDQDCQPLPNAWLDFWQADANGEYDNSGYRLRGHQFTDAQGRYYLETILPGLYASRPIEHIHVKVRPEGGQELTSQLYFPQQPVEGLTVTLEERADYVVGYFNFVVPR